MATLISFPNTEPTWVFDRDAVRFYALVDRKVVNCLISGEALRDVFGAPTNLDPEKCLSAFRANRPAIEQVARRKIETGEFDPVSGVRVRADDFAGHTVRPRVVVRESEALRAEPALLSGVREATTMMEEIFVPANSSIQAYWNGIPGDPPLAQITLSDEASGAIATSDPLTPDGLSDRSTVRYALYRLWDDFLSSQFHQIRGGLTANPGVGS